MNKRVISFIITLAMVVSFIPQTALADTENYDVYVKGTQVTSGNMDDVLRDGGKVKYTPKIGNTPATLTLEDAEIEASKFDGDAESGIYYSGGDELIIHLVGSNSVKRDADGNSYANVIFSQGPLTITADPGASLALLANNGSTGNYGISAHKGLTIESGDITATGGNSSGGWGVCNYGIFVE